MQSWSTLQTTYSGYVRVALVGGAAAAAIVLLFKTWKIAYPSEIPPEAGDILDRVASPKRFTLQELQDATQNFSETNLVSDTKLGRIYDGKLPGTGEKVTVKVLPKTPESTELLRHKVAVMSCLRHRNIVRLKGFCIEDDTCVLVYAPLPRASLKTCLFGGGGGEGLSWPERYSITAQIIHALVHLHHDSSYIVCHGSLDVASVLLAGNSRKVVKISDFRRACFQERTFGGDTIGSEESRDYRDDGRSITLGFAPRKAFALESHPFAEGRGGLVLKAQERQEALRLRKDDVYGFGVILLQLVTGREVRFEIDGKPWHIVEWVRVSKANVAEIIDPRLSTFDQTQVNSLVVLGLHCCQLDAYLM